MAQILRDWITVFLLVLVVIVFALAGSAIFPSVNEELEGREAVQDMGAEDEYAENSKVFTIILYIVLGGAFLYALFAAFRTESVWRRL